MKFLINLKPTTKLILVLIAAGTFYAFLFYLLIIKSSYRHESNHPNKLPNTESVRR